MDIDYQISTITLRDTKLDIIVGPTRKIERV